VERSLIVPSGWRLRHAWTQYAEASGAGQRQRLQTRVPATRQQWPGGYAIPLVAADAARGRDAWQRAIWCLIGVMDNPNSTEQRLTALEVKASFADDLLDQLNQTIFRQQQQIDLLTRELVELRKQLPAADGAGFRSLRDELPPHY
jgi:SlyX protein